MTATTTTPIPLILDTDIGTDVDDAIALAQVALDERFDLRLVTCVNGDTDLRARLARVVLDACGRDDVPVAAGRRLPLAGEASPTMPLWLGHEGEGVDLDIEGFDPPDAETSMVNVLEGADEPITVCTIGALTNIAAVLGNRPDLCERVRKLHVMGGTIGPLHLGGGRPPVEGYAETNIGGDDLASAVVWGLPLPIRLVPIDVTLHVAFDEDEIAAIADAGRLGALLGPLMERWIKLLQRGGSDRTGLVRLHDPITTAGVIRPDLLTMETLSIALVGRPSRVLTLESPYGRPIEAVRACDGPAIRRLLVDTITGSRSN